MKKWVEKLIQQFDFEWSETNIDGSPNSSLSEDRATLLFMIDTINKHLIEFDGHPVRKVREQLDEFAKDLLRPQDGNLERVLFRFRQFYSSYRVDECAYFHKTFDEFRTIIWDFVDQLSEDMGHEQKEDQEIKLSLENLKEAVESNSIDVLKDHSRKFIDCYSEKQFKRDKRKSSRMKSIRKKLNVVQKQLVEATDSMRLDHLTEALNRKSFDESCSQLRKLFQVSNQPTCLMLIDIDYFKRINDTYGHGIGDFVLKELVKSLKGVFQRETDLVARIGGEEFAILLPECEIKQALIKAEEVMTRIRSEAFVHDGHEIRFTVSIGLAQLNPNETEESWLKRADLALYNSKNTGRNRASVAPDALVRAA